MIRRLLLSIASVAVLAAVLAVAVFPTRTYLDQRRQLRHAEERVELLGRENERLAARVRLLHKDTEIERLAREQYSLVRPGEEAFAVLPAPGEQPPAPRTVLAAETRDDRGVWDRLKDFVAFWN